MSRVSAEVGVEDEMLLERKLQLLSTATAGMKDGAPRVAPIRILAQCMSSQAGG